MNAAEVAAVAADVEAYLCDTASNVDPYPAYRRLREVAPVYRSEATNSWIVTGFPEAEALFRSPHLSRQEAGARQFGWLAGPDDTPEVARAVQAWLSTVLNLDPPEHTRLRRLMSRAFSPRSVAKWEARTVQVVDDVLAGLGARVELDLLNEVGYPIPERVICEIMGVPAEDHDRWKQWSSGMNQAAVFAGSGARLPEEALRTAQDSVVRWYGYFSDLVDRRRGSDGDDLISELVRVEEEGDRLSEMELIGTLILLIGAGHDTTANLFANAMLALMRQPQQYAALRTDPSLASAAVEEILRFDGSARGQPRVATADIEIEGQTIRSGDLVAVIVNAANRDPRRFADPESFDITRADSGHLGFSGGIHYCLGAALARMEVAVELRAVAAAPYRFELASADLAYKRTHGRNLVGLPVRRVSP